MKICYLCTDLGIPMGGSKGASAHVRGLTEAFRDLGHEVTVLSPRPDGADTPKVPVRPMPTSGLGRALGDSVSRPLGRALGHLWNNVATESALRTHLRTSRPDIVYERYSPFSVAGGLVAKQHGVPHVLEVNAPLAWEGSAYRSQAMADASAELEMAAFRQADCVVAVSDTLAGMVVAAGVDPNRVFVVPNGVDTEAFKPRGPSRRTPPHAFVMGFVGSLKPWHGIDLIVESFERLATDPRVHLLVVGQGPEARRIDKLVERHPERVARIAVPHAEVPRYLRSMHVALAPYPEIDSFYFSPLKVLEYMAAGRAVVASGIGQITDLIDDGRSGLLVPPGDVDALCDALRTLASDPGLRARLGRAAAQEAQLKHRWHDRARDILSRTARLRSTAEPAVERAPAAAPVPVVKVGGGAEHGGPAIAGTAGVA